MGARIAGLLFLPLALQAPPPSLPADLGQSLRQLGFTRQDLGALAAGQPVSRLLDEGRNDLTGAVAAVRITGAPLKLVDHLRTIERSEAGDQVLGLGRFSASPSLEDVQALVLPATDIDDLRRCRPGACDINLSERAIVRFRTELDWSAPDVAGKAEGLLRDVLVEYLRRYQQAGNDALIVYGDRKRPISLRDSSLQLFERAEMLTAHVPAVATYFYYFPTAPRPPGAEEIYYWSQSTFGLKPVTRLNHAMVAPFSADGHPGWVMASRQLYASHYFRDALELRFVIPDTPMSGGYYFVCVNRATSDSLRGFTGAVIGGAVRRGVRDGMVRYVTAIRRAMEGA